MVQLLKEFDFSLTSVKKFQKMKGNPAGKLPINCSSSWVEIFWWHGEKLSKRSHPSIASACAVFNVHLDVLLPMQLWSLPNCPTLRHFIPHVFSFCSSIIYKHWGRANSSIVCDFFISIKLNVSFEFRILYNMKISPKLSSSGLKFKVTLASQIRLIFL